MEGVVIRPSSILRLPSSPLSGDSPSTCFARRRFRHPESLGRMSVVSLSAPAFVSPFLGRKLAYSSNGPRAVEKCQGRSFPVPRCSYEGSVPTFPRVNVWDPYKRLGVSPDASEEEIWGSHNFLFQRYAGHERSEEAIEAAFEKPLMASFEHRKKTKINLKTKLKKKVDESPPWVKNLLNFVELPPTDVIFRRLFLFAFMGGWSIMNSAEGGPAFQVAVSLAACIYFLNEKTELRKSICNRPRGPHNWMGMWFDCGSHGSNRAVATDLDSRTPDIASRICLPISWVYLP